MENELKVSVKYAAYGIDEDVLSIELQKIDVKMLLT